MSYLKSNTKIIWLGAFLCLLISTPLSAEDTWDWSNLRNPVPCNIYNSGPYGSPNLFYNTLYTSSPFYPACPPITTTSKIPSYWTNTGLSYPYTTTYTTVPEAWNTRSIEPVLPFPEGPPNDPYYDLKDSICQNLSDEELSTIAKEKNMLYFSVENDLTTNKLNKIIKDKYRYTLPMVKKHQWGLHKINCDKAWELSTNIAKEDPNKKSLGEGVVVAVIDSGVDITHEDLQYNIWINQDELKVIDSAGNDLYAELLLIDQDTTIGNNDGNIDAKELLAFLNEDIEGDNEPDGDYNGDGKANLADLLHADPAINPFWNDIDEDIDEDEKGYVNDFFGYNFADDTPNPDIIDYDGHGTAVASVIAATGNNGLGMIGVAPEAKIMVIKAPVGLLNSRQIKSRFINAIYYAVNHKSNIINMSYAIEHNADQFPPTEPLSALEDAIIHAHERNCLIIGAQGNRKPSIYTANAYPASYTRVMSIGATDTTDKIWSISNYGYTVEVVAPGNNIIVCLAEHASNFFKDMEIFPGYLSWCGTSFAAPYVSGLAALMLSLNDKLTNEEIRSILRCSAVDLKTEGRDDYSGYGRIDAHAALEMVEDGLSMTCLITSPSPNSYVTFYDRYDPTTSVPIKGYAGGTDFEVYEITIKQLTGPNAGNIIEKFNGSSPVADNDLAIWKPNSNPLNPSYCESDQMYEIKLKVPGTDYILENLIHVYLMKNFKKNILHFYQNQENDFYIPSSSNNKWRINWFYIADPIKNNFAANHLNLYNKAADFLEFVCVAIEIEDLNTGRVCYPFHDSRYNDHDDFLIVPGNKYRIRVHEDVSVTLWTEE